MASSFLREKAKAQTKRIDEEWGSTAYMGSDYTPPTTQKTAAELGDSVLDRSRWSGSYVPGTDLNANKPQSMAELMVDVAMGSKSRAERDIQKPDSIMLRKSSGQDAQKAAAANTTGNIARQTGTAKENYDKAMEEYRLLSSLEQAREAGVNIHTTGITAEHPYATAEEALAAAKQYKQQQRELANQYYYEENTQTLQTLRADANLSAQYDAAKELQADMDKLTAVMAEATSKSGDAEAQEAQKYLAEKYGLTQEAVNNYAVYGTTYLPAGDGYTNIYQLYTELESKKKKAVKALSKAGYDYDRLTGYEQTIADAEEYEKKQAEWQAYANEHPVRASAGSVLVSPFQGLDYVTTMAKGIGHSDIDNLDTYEPLNVYDMNATNYVSTVRGTVSKKIEDSTDWELFGKNVGSFLYETGMSVADSAVQVGTFGSGAVWLMGASAASNQARDIIQRGGTNDQAFWGGLASGAAEVFFEKISVDQLLSPKSVDGWKSLLRETLKQAGTEASEETLTEIANILSDAAIMGENSQFSQSVAQYRQEKHMTEEQAKRQAFLDCVGQVAWAGAGGALSGGVMGGVTSAAQMNRSGGIKADTSLFDRSVLEDSGTARTYLIDYARKNFPQSVVNQDTGKTIGISRKGLDKFLSGYVYYEKYATGFHIPELIENGVKVDRQDNYHPKNVNDIPTYEYYESPIQVDGTDYMARIRVRNTRVGDKYYGHTISEVDNIEVEPATRTPSSQSDSANSVKITGSTNESIPDSAEEFNPQNAENAKPMTMAEIMAEVATRGAVERQQIANAHAFADSITAQQRAAQTAQTAQDGVLQPGEESIPGATENAATGRETAQAGAERISLEDFANTESPIWNNVEYDDTATQARITKDTHASMVEEGRVVRVPESTVEQVGKSYPDLRTMKKSERLPIIKQKISELKSTVREFLNGLKGGYEFSVDGNILEAKLYDTGVREVLHKLTQDKSAMLLHSDAVFANARYMYSLPDYDGNPNIYRWNYFYSPVQIGNEVLGVRIAIRDMARGTDLGPESQIYNWDIKEDASLDGGGRGRNNPVASLGVSSDASIGESGDFTSTNDIIPTPAGKVNPENAKPVTMAELMAMPRAEREGTNTENAGGTPYIYEESGGPGAAKPRTRTMVPTQNVAETSGALSPELQQAARESTPEHEKISQRLANSLADEYIARDAAGNWVNFEQVKEDLEAEVKDGQILSSEEVKLAFHVLQELGRRARETGDLAEYKAFNRDVWAKSGSQTGQSLQARGEYAWSAGDVTAKAQTMMEENSPDPNTRKNRRRVKRLAEETRQTVEGEVADAAAAAAEQLTMLDVRPTAREVLQKSWNTKQNAVDALTKALTEQRGLEGQRAEKLANYIATAFYDELAVRSEEALERDFGAVTKKGQERQQSAVEKITGYINEGALTDEFFREAASEKLFGGRASDEALLKVMDYTEKAQTHKENGDAQSLREQVIEMSEGRGYKPKGRVRKAIMDETDIETLYILAQTEALGIACDSIPASGGEKVSTFQTISHLLNAKTCLRNVLSNQLFAPLDRLANETGIAADYILALINAKALGLTDTVSQARTVAHQPMMFNKDVKATRRAYVTQARIDNALDINRGNAQNKYRNGEGYTNRTFKRHGAGAVLNRLEGLMGAELNVTDAFQKGTTKGQSEAAMGKLQATQGSRMTQTAAERITENEMLYRSFQRKTPVGEFLGQVKKGLNLGKNFGAGDLTTKYTNVPGALVHTLADYSPLGAFNVVEDVARMIQFNNANPELTVEENGMSRFMLEHIDSGKYSGLSNTDAAIVAQHNAAVDLARSVTGTSIALAGYALVKAGLLALSQYGGSDKDRDEAEAGQGLSGLQWNVSATLRPGDGNQWQEGDVLVDISQLDPIGDMISMGAIMAEEEDDNKAAAMMEAAAQGIISSFSDLSMMTTAKSIANNIRYKDEDETWWDVTKNIGGDLAANSISGFVWGPIRQTATAFDNTRRDTRGDSWPEEFGNKLASAIPGWRNTLPASVDYKGEAKTYTGKTWLNALNAYAMPGTVSLYKQDDAVDYLDGVYQSTDTNVFPTAYAPNSISQDGETYALDAAAKRAYNTAYKSAYYGLVTGFMESSAGGGLSDEDTAEVLAGLKSFAADAAKQQAIANAGGETKDNYKWLTNVDAENVPGAFALKQAVETLADSEGTDTAGFDAAYEWYKSQSYGQQAALREGISGLDKLARYLSAGNAGTPEQFYAAKKYHDELDKDESMSATEKAEDFAVWLDRQGYTVLQKANLKSSLAFFSYIPADTAKYDELTEGGLSTSKADAVWQRVSALEPETGHSNVRDIQKYESITGQAGLSESEKLGALEVYASESAYNYYRAAYDYGIDLDKWTAVQRYIADEKNGKISYAGVKEAFRYAGLTEKECVEMWDVYAYYHQWTKSYYQAAG